jgi:hypothetical protein
MVQPARYPPETPTVQPLRITDLPIPPRLRNTQVAAGPREKYMVLAYVMTWDDIAAWVARHEIPTTQEWINIMDLGMRGLRKYMPRKCTFWSVRLESGDVKPAWILASNKSEEHLRRAQDLEMIEEVRRIIGTTDAPQWYRPGK